MSLLLWSFSRVFHHPCFLIRHHAYINIFGKQYYLGSILLLGLYVAIRFCVLVFSCGVKHNIIVFVFLFKIMIPGHCLDGN